MRYARPWKRKDGGSWYVQINGEQVCLGPNRAAAMAKYHELIGDGPTKPAKAILDRFLTHCEKHAKPATYEFYKPYNSSARGAHRLHP